MIRINLLPHRAEKRKARQIQFYVLSAITLVIAAMLVGFVHVVINTQIEYQERRNRYLTDQIALLDKQIAEIKRLKMEIAALMERKTVVEKLQSTRSDVVHLLDQMLNILPESVYLKSIKQTGNQVNLVGFTQSNARVSTLMRSIDSSQWLESPTLVQISATTASTNGPRLNEFTLNFNLTTQAPTIPASPARAVGTKVGKS
jgi:type IV pilus assembly protein PilN